MELLFTGKIDGLGRLQIPKIIREKYELEEDVNVFGDGHAIYVKRKTPSCVICNAEVSENSKTVKGKFICTDCATKIK